MVSVVWTLLGLGCIDAMLGAEEWEQEAWLSTSSKLIEAPAQEVHRLEEFLVPQPWYADSVSGDTVSKCLAGEDVRAYISSGYAVMEIEQGAIKVGDNQATWLEDGAAPPYDQANGRILSLYEALLGLKGQSRMLSGACFPPTDGKLLVVLSREVPAPLAWQAISTASDAGFDQIYLMVSDPAAELKAQSSPPRPPFKPGTQAIRERVPTLSPEELVKARVQLAAGGLVSEQGRVCLPSGRVGLGAPGDSLDVDLLDGAGQVQAHRELPKSGLVGAFSGDLESVWVLPKKNSTAGELIEVLALLDSDDLQPSMQVLAAESVDFMKWEGSTQLLDVDPYWTSSSDYNSRSSDTWISVIPLRIGRRNAGPCIDPATQP